MSRCSITSFDIDAWAARLDPYGSRLLYGTFLGGTGDEEQVGALCLDDGGSVLITGDTDSADFPVTPGSADPTHNGSNDTYVMRLTMLPTGVARFGASTAGCLGALPIGVTAMPQPGHRFGFTCSAAPPNARGFLLLARNGLPSPVGVEGFDLWLDPATLGVVPGITSDARGWVVFERTIPATPALVGYTAAAQFVFPDECAPGGWSATAGLRLDIQP